MSGIDLRTPPGAALPASLTSERLILRMPAPADAPALNAAILESFPELNAWMDWATSKPSVADTRAFCEQAAADRRAGSACPLLMVRRDDGSIVGATGYARIDWMVPSFEIGYWCRTSLVGRGYVAEATVTLTRHAFAGLGARRVHIRMDDRNTRSAAVAERLGFPLEGVLRQDVRDHHGRLRDTRVYALTDVAGLRGPSAGGGISP